MPGYGAIHWSKGTSSDNPLKEKMTLFLPYQLSIAARVGVGACESPSLCATVLTGMTLINLAQATTAAESL